MTFVVEEELVAVVVCLVVLVVLVGLVTNYFDQIRPTLLHRGFEAK